MAARSIACLTLSFGLVSIPVKLFTATETSSTVRFNMLAKDGSRVKQQYISEKDRKVVERAEMVKGYEFEKDRYVIFTPEELKALESPTHAVEIVAFVPTTRSIRCTTTRPICWPRTSAAASRTPCWAGHARQRPLCARPMGIEGQAVRGADPRGRGRPRAAAAAVRQRGALAEGAGNRAGHGVGGRTEPCHAADRPDLPGRLRPHAFADEEKDRILAAIDEKIAGKQIVAVEPAEAPASAQVIDLMEALRASLRAASRQGQGRRQGRAERRPRRPRTQRRQARRQGGRARRGAREGPSEEATRADAKPLHAAQHRGDARPRPQRHGWADRRGLRLAGPRRAQRVPLHVPGRRPAAHRHRLRAAKIPPRRPACARVKDKLPVGCR